MGPSDIKAEAQRVIAAQGGTLTRFEECSSFYGWTAFVGGKTVVGELVNVDSFNIEHQMRRDIVDAGGLLVESVPAQSAGIAFDGAGAFVTADTDPVPSPTHSEEVH